MGAFDSKVVEPEQTGQETLSEGIIEIQGEGPEPVTVRVRVAVTEEDQQWVMNRYLNSIAKQRKSTPEQDLKLLDALWIECLLIDWNLPISLENKAKAVATLSQADRDCIYQRIKAEQPETPLRRRQLGNQKRLPPALQEAVKRRQKPRGKTGHDIIESDR